MLHQDWRGQSGLPTLTTSTEECQSKSLVPFYSLGKEILTKIVKRKIAKVLYIKLN